MNFQLSKRRNYILSDKGEISFIGILIVMMALSLWSVLILNNLKSLKDLQKRTHFHLCFKYLYTKTKKYQTRMSHLNKTIKASYYISLIPATRAQAKAAIKVAQMTQSLLYVSYLKNISTYKRCSMTASFNFIKNMPYKKVLSSSLGLFKRDFEGKTIMKRKQWSIIYYYNPINLLEEKITIEYRGKSSLSPPSSKVSHKMKQDFRLSQVFYGQLSF